MSKMFILVTNLKNRRALEALGSQRPLIFNFGNLKLRDMAKLSFFQTDYDKIKLKKISYDVISVTLS